jgi:hypothetical protein
MTISFRPWLLLELNATRFVDAKAHSKSMESSFAVAGVLMSCLAITVADGAIADPVCEDVSFPLQKDYPGCPCGAIRDSHWLTCCGTMNSATEGGKTAKDIRFEHMSA